MGAKFSTRRNPSSAEQVDVEPNNLPSTPISDREYMERLFEGKSREFRRFHFRSDRKFRQCVHNAISKKDLGYLKFLVEDCDASLEETDQEGMTALYHAVFSYWTEGALLLLKHGADVRNADQTLRDSCCFFFSLVHAVLRLGSVKLLKEVIKRGAAITESDFEANNYFDCATIHSSQEIRDFLYQEVIEKKLQKGHGQDSLVALFNAIYSVKHVDVNASKMENIIRWKHAFGKLQTKLVLGAWLAIKGSHYKAVKCWRKALKGKTLGQAEEQVKASDSVFADILHVDLHGLLHSPEIRDLDVRVLSLLILEKYTPTDTELALAAMDLATSLWNSNNEITAVAVLLCLTSVRTLHKDETFFLVKTMKTFFQLRSPTDFSLSVLLESIVILNRCLSILTEDGSFSQDGSVTNRHDVSNSKFCSMCLAIYNLIDVFLQITNCIEQDVTATAEQLLKLHRNVQVFVSTFPWIRGQNLFHLLAPGIYYKDYISVIKTLVVCSAEMNGSNRHENSPPHLAPDMNGDTPLHLFACNVTQEELVKEGVLQCFLDHGAHLCTRNIRGESIRNMLLREELLEEEQTVLPLQCLAATAFMNDACLRRCVDTCEPVKVRHFLLDH